MDIILWILLPAIAAVAIAAFFLPHKISLKEAAVVFCIVAAVTTMIVAASKYSNLFDTEILSGQVVNKYSRHVSCSHSYECRCRNVSYKTGTKTSYRRVCDTCYEHAYDVNWIVESSIGNSYINRVDRRGLREPPRFTAVQIGEPYADTHAYQNYVKATGTLFSSVFTPEEEKLIADTVPKYPAPFDYYRMNRALPLVGIPNTQDWNDELALTLRDLGAAKQVNIIVVFTDRERQWADLFERAWVGGKKNDVTVVYGLNKDQTISWVHVFTYARSSGNELFVVKLRDELQKFTTITEPAAHVSTIRSIIISDYVRKPMAAFEYLADSAAPSDSAITMAIIMMLVLLGVGLFVSYHKPN